MERELELSTLQQELVVFEAEYLRVVGRRYAALDDINARIAEAQAARRPDDHAALQEARNARETADVTVAQAEGDVPDAEPVPPFEPPAGLKALYRAAARKLHPDLATTDDERALRHEWMAKVNEAYGLGVVDGTADRITEDVVGSIPVEHECLGRVSGRSPHHQRYRSSSRRTMGAIR